MEKQLVSEENVGSQHQNSDVGGESSNQASRNAAQEMQWHGELSENIKVLTGAVQVLAATVQNSSTKRSNNDETLELICSSLVRMEQNLMSMAGLSIAPTEAPQPKKRRVAPSQDGTSFGATYRRSPVKKVTNEEGFVLDDFTTRIPVPINIPSVDDLKRCLKNTQTGNHDPIAADRDGNGPGYSTGARGSARIRLDLAPKARLGPFSSLAADNHTTAAEGRHGEGTLGEGECVLHDKKTGSSPKSRGDLSKAKGPAQEGGYVPSGKARDTTKRGCRLGDNPLPTKRRRQDGHQISESQQTDNDAGNGTNRASRDGDPLANDDSNQPLKLFRFRVMLTGTQAGPPKLPTLANKPEASFNAGDFGLTDEQARIATYALNPDGDPEEELVKVGQCHLTRRHLLTLSPGNISDPKIFEAVAMRLTLSNKRTKGSRLWEPSGHWYLTVIGFKQRTLYYLDASMTEDEYIARREFVTKIGERISSLISPLHYPLEFCRTHGEVICFGVSPVKGLPRGQSRISSAAWVLNWLAMGCAFHYNLIPTMRENEVRMHAAIGLLLKAENERRD
ncbi:hypothetical protein PIB30_054875 [Stylosanthes scabra]|uniref:Uncharacterized protein n=1 Tax=Stylosanthes scabra TaxID=79078 RepID=A0ABU6XK35_9FABA|nr:hypothetical protein [Stylosanthes scabra]